MRGCWEGDTEPVEAKRFGSSRFRAAAVDVPVKTALGSSYRRGKVGRIACGMCCVGSAVLRRFLSEGRTAPGGFGGSRARALGSEGDPLARAASARGVDAVRAGGVRTAQGGARAAVHRVSACAQRSTGLYRRVPAGREWADHEHAAGPAGGERGDL